MIKKVLFIQPFVLKDFFYNLKLSNEILLWVVHLENFLKLKIDSLKFDFLHLGFELKDGKINLENYSDNNKFANQMQKILNSVAFEIDGTTLISLTSTTSYHYLSTILIANYFKQHHNNSIISIGGTHATVKPEDYLFEGSPFDYIVIGEGEKSIYTLIKDNLKKKTKPFKLSYPPITDLNTLPPLDFSIYERYLSNYNHLNLFLSRGCPFNCNFCIEKNIRKANAGIPKWRPYSPKSAIRNFEYLIQLGLKYNIKTYGIYDPIFGLDNVWLNKFLDEFQFQNEILNVFTETRFDHLNESLIKKFIEKKFLLFFGLESFSEKMLKILNKSNNPRKYLKKFEEIRQILAKQESPYFISILMNHLGETQETTNQTLNRITEIKDSDSLDLSNFSFTTYYAVPGSFTYENQKFYEESYGSKIYFPNWWKDETLLKYGAIMIKPSASLSLKQALENYVNSATLTKQKSLEQLKRNKPPHYFQKALLIQNEIKDIALMGKNFHHLMDLPLEMET